jgi:hypothetical protein
MTIGQHGAFEPDRVAALQRVHGSSPCAPTIEINELGDISHYSFKSKNGRGSSEGNKQ